MSKSLFGQDQERLHRTTAEESKEHFQPIDCRIVKTISNYKQLEDLSSREIVGIKKVLSMLEEDTLEIKTGVYFLVVTEDNRFALVPSPKTEDELRGLYGSDANLIGRILSIRTLNKDLHNIQRKDVEFKASEKEALEDNDKYIPINVGIFYGSSIDAKSKLNAFKANTRSGRGVYYEQWI